MELGTVQKPVRRLRERLKSLRVDPSIEAVHDLRTYARRVEAIVAALQMEEKKPARRLLKTIKAVRKAAGAVRDMDVLAGNALTLARNHRDDSLLRLLQHLHALRIASAQRLVDAVEEHGKEARSSLKQFSRQIERLFKEKNSGGIETAARAPHRNTAARLLNELNRWPQLEAGNLHEFRIKAKELRYVLQLGKGADPVLVEALDAAREQIGDWHDWQELAKIAQTTLDPEADRAALQRIAETEDRKFNLALRAAEAVRAIAVHSSKPAEARKNLAAHSGPA